MVQQHSREYKLRGAVSSDDSAMDLTATSTAAAEIATVEANAVHLDPGFQDYEVFFIGTGSGANTNVSLYGWTNSKAIIYILGKWSLELGTQACTVAPWGEAISGGLLVDTITADADYWDEVNLVDEGADNHCARLKFYARGLPWLYAEFENVGSGSEMTTVYAGYRPY